MKRTSEPTVSAWLVSTITLQLALRRYIRKPKHQLNPFWSVSTAFVFSLLLSSYTHAISYNEATDGELGGLPGAQLQLDIGINTFSGTIEATAPAQQDAVTFTLPANSTITVFNYSSGPNFGTGGSDPTGFVTWQVGSVSGTYRSPQGRTFVPAQSSGGFFLVSADFNTRNRAWSISIQVESNGAPTNQPPVAVAGQNQTIEATSTSGAQTTLDGSSSSDPDNNPITYSWSGAFGTASGAMPTVTLPIGTNTVTLLVSDGTASDTDTVDITVADTFAPAAAPVIAPSANTAGWINSDANINWNWSDNGSGIDLNNCTTSTSTTSEGTLNPNAFCADLSGNSTVANVTLNVDKTAPITSLSSTSPPSTSPTGNATFAFTGSDTGSGLAGFECQLNTSAYTACTSPENYTGLTNGNYTFNVRSVDIADNADGSPATYSWTVQLNTAPVINSSATASVIENQTSATDVQATDDYDGEGVGNGLTFEKSGDDESFFNLDSSTGLLTFATAPDFETPLDANSDNNYELKVKVTDTGGLSTEQNITITVTNELDGTFTNLQATASNSGFATVNGTNQTDNIVITGTGPGSVAITDGDNDGAPVGMQTNLTQLRINGKGGMNTITLVNVDIPGTITISGGTSADKVSINGSLNVGGGLNIDLGKGDNMLMASSATATVNVTLNANVETGNGNDTIYFPNIATGGHLDIDTGAGEDNITIGAGTVTIGNRLTIQAGSGDNNVTVTDGVFTNAAQIFSGSGMDDISLKNSSGSLMDIISGSGNDGVDSDSNNFSNRYRVNCGPGTDTLITSSDLGNPFSDSQCEIVN